MACIKGSQLASYVASWHKAGYRAICTMHIHNTDIWYRWLHYKFLQGDCIGN